MCVAKFSGLASNFSAFRMSGCLHHSLSSQLALCNLSNSIHGKFMNHPSLLFRGSVNIEIMSITYTFWRALQDNCVYMRRQQARDNFEDQNNVALPPVSTLPGLHDWQASLSQLGTLPQPNMHMLSNTWSMKNNEMNPLVTCS